MLNILHVIRNNLISYVIAEHNIKSTEKHTDDNSNNQDIRPEQSIKITVPPDSSFFSHKSPFFVLMV